MGRESFVPIKQSAILGISGVSFIVDVLQTFLREMTMSNLEETEN